MRNLKKIAFLALCMLIAALTVCGAAAAEESRYVEWTLSEDEETLTGDGKVYTVYYAPISYTFDTKNRFVYENTVERSIGTTTVRSYAYSGEYAWLHRDGYSRLFVTDKGRQMLSEFFSGETALYRLLDMDENVASFDAATAQMLATMHSAGASAEMDVRELEGVTRYEIEAYDETDSLFYQYGCVYRLSDGKYYYLHYLTLDNAHFDSDGDFSYRSGSVKLVLLSDNIGTVIEDAAGRTEYRERTTTYERDLYAAEGEYTDTDGSGFWIVAFWVVFALLGFAAPLPFLIAGFVLPRSKKRGYPEYWYILAIIASIWLLLSGVLFVILVV